MSIQILNVAPGAAAPDGLQELARIRCRKTPGHQLWELPLNLLEGEGLDELWCVKDTVNSTPIMISGGQIQQHKSADYSMYWLQLDTTQFDSFAAVTAYAWQQVLYSLQAGHSELLKTWHYLPGINDGEGDQERYRQFCIGREHTLLKDGWDGQLPSATAIGIPDRDAPLVMYWLTGDNPTKNIENPRQTSAWEYPRDYGPSSPNFSRATLDAKCGLLLISGTASVVGHATTHPSNTLSQTGDMLVNLDKLLEVSTNNTELQSISPNLRVYLRHADDWSVVKQKLIDSGFQGSHLLPFGGDICRRDLMVELDGFLLRNL